MIGNGFDLWHGIPSSFGQFKQFVHQTAPDIYREVEAYLPAGDDWCELEQALADLDGDALVDDLGQFMASYSDDDWSDSGHHDFQYEVKNCVERLSFGLKTQFANWIRGLQIPTAATSPQRLKLIDQDALFFSLNYTNTLTEVYGVQTSRVLFIHGCAELADDELILGHAWNPEGRISITNRTDSEDMDARLVEANEIIDEYFSKTFKKSDEVITRHQRFFSGLGDIEQVFVLGHSLSDVDAPYFRALVQHLRVGQATWHVACQIPSEWPEKARLLERLPNPNHPP